ncbi:hypothetical protein GALL_515000 [mine drainage metagenome]|uniref:Uncharacterized protein n=1 Tax=mine drainage metagenome TaxID=410659 RepID=A0A1J5PGK1_9ZZZZ
MLSWGALTGAGGGGGGCRTCGSAWGCCGWLSFCGVRLSGGVGKKGTQPCPANAISTHAWICAPVNVIDDAPTCGPDGTNPRTTRAGNPICLAIRAIAEAYCSPSPTIRPPPSRVAMRFAPCPASDGYSPTSVWPLLKYPSSAKAFCRLLATRTGAPAVRAISAARTPTTSGTSTVGGSTTSAAGALPIAVSSGTDGSTASTVYDTVSESPPVSTAAPVASL